MLCPTPGGQVTSPVLLFKKTNMNEVKKSCDGGSRISEEAHEALACNESRMKDSAGLHPHGARTKPQRCCPPHLDRHSHVLNTTSNKMNYDIKYQESRVLTYRHSQRFFCWWRTVQYGGPTLTLHTPWASAYWKDPGRWKNMKSVSQFRESV